MSFILVSHWEECRVLSVWPQYYLTLIIEWLSVNQIILCLKENPLDYRKTSPQVPASVCNTSLPQLLMMRGSLENKLPHLPQLSSPWWFVAASVTCCRKVHGSHFVLTKQQCNTPRSRCFIGNRCTFQWHLSVSGKLGWLYAPRSVCVSWELPYSSLRSTGSYVHHAISGKAQAPINTYYSTITTAAGSPIRENNPIL